MDWRFIISCLEVIPLSAIKMRSDGMIFCISLELLWLMEKSFRFLLLTPINGVLMLAFRADSSS